MSVERQKLAAVYAALTTQHIGEVGAVRDALREANRRDPVEPAHLPEPATIPQESEACARAREIAREWLAQYLSRFAMVSKERFEMAEELARQLDEDANGFALATLMRKLRVEPVEVSTTAAEVCNGLPGLNAAPLIERLDESASRGDVTVGALIRLIESAVDVLTEPAPEAEPEVEPEAEPVQPTQPAVS